MEHYHLYLMLCYAKVWAADQYIVSNNVLKGASSYVIQITTNVLSKTSWKQADVSLKSRGNVLSDLKWGTQIWVRVAGVGSKGQGAWSGV